MTAAYNNLTVKQLRKLMSDRKLKGRSKVTRKADIISFLIACEAQDAVASETKLSFLSGEIKIDKYLIVDDIEYQILDNASSTIYAAIKVEKPECVEYFPRASAQVVDYRTKAMFVALKANRKYNKQSAFQCVDRLATQQGGYRDTYLYLLKSCGIAA